ncbi:MbnP family protein [Tenacibaculum caenipelagi]|uniref:Outer membrane autotransporter protein n=1 Tax=Tenacibaculum caenipelagi TaxID=1325435 RepID=A0A4R6T9C8_9FLAO|nr:MbnP family protein [Tenacibaculum caenipelagi]TDQ22011.1 outer membrane autotransporter protein [Tenacibaculum caenipelagi]
MRYFLTLFLSVLLFSCSSDNDEPIKEVSVKLKFTQNWDGTTIKSSDLNNTEYTNKLGTKLNINKLRYLISRVALTNGAGDTTKFEGYKLVDISKPDDLTFSLSQKVSEGNYKLSFTFGFTEEDNTDGAYPDLNTASWGVPEMLGGGYHFMQLDGNYKDSEGKENPYNFHVIRAYDTTTNTSEDTSFTIEAGSVLLKNNATIEIKMNVAGWFKTPNDWDLNEKNIELMPDFEAQKLMSENGQTGVFSLGTITQ